ncbi:putative 6-phosphofructo-2-kinase [Helianthus debilis subsp. tardiflorus]
MMEYEHECLFSQFQYIQSRLLLYRSHWFTILILSALAAVTRVPPCWICAPFVTLLLSRKKDKLRYRYPRGESYLDVKQRVGARDNQA